MQQNKILLVILAGVLLISLAGSVVYFQMKKSVPAESMPPVAITQTNTTIPKDTKLSEKSAGGISTDRTLSFRHSDVDVIEKDGKYIRLGGITTRTAYVIRNAPGADVVTFSGTDLFHRDLAIEVGALDANAGSYEKYFSSTTILSVTPLTNGDLIVGDLGHAVFNVWSNAQQTFTKHYEIPVPLVKENKNCGQNLSPVESPILSPDGSTLAVLSAQVCGYDYPVKLFLVDIESGELKSYVVPTGDKVFKGDIYGPAEWVTQNYISFRAGYPKGCAAWDDGARFYVKNAHFVEGKGIDVGLTSPGGLKIVVTHDSMLPFNRNDGVIDSKNCYQPLTG